MLGRTIHQYRILERLGAGGMGVVYRAEDTRLGRSVALKFLPSELTRDPDARARFLREARAASRLDHPNICPIHDVGRTPDGQLFISMAYCRGRSLRERMERGPLPLDEAVDIALQVARGLECAHAAGIVHRDIKPANIMISPQGEVRIVDFGLARSAAEQRLTRPGIALGTVAYMAPEQARGQPLDHRTDLWSLGVVLSEMLSGSRPFPADNLAALVHAIEHRDPEPLSTPGRPVPPLLEQLATSCLAKDPARRCGAAGEVRRQLEAISRLLDPRARLAAEPTTVMLPAARRRGPTLRHASLLAAALAAAILLGGPSRLLRGLGLGTDARGRGAALLPLTLVGEEAADRPLCDGLTHALTACLARLESRQDDAWIVPASEVRSRGVVGVDDARGLLGVRRTVGGALQVHGDVLRLELIRNEGSRGDWRSLLARPESRTVTGTLDELPAWQARAVAAAAELLGWNPAPAAAGMGGPARGCGTHVPQAHAWHLRGCGLLQPFAGEPDPAAAVACFERALAADSTYAAARAGLGLALWRRHAGGEPDDGRRALAACASAMRQDGAAPEPPAALGAIHRARGEHEQALACFRRCLEIAPGDARALYLLARTQEALGRPDEAEAVYRRAVSRRPGFMAAHNHYGAFLYRRNRYEEAVAQFREVVELAPSYLRGLNNLGGICFYLERWSEAEAAFRRSLAVRPTPTAYLNLGTLYFYDRRYVEAAHMYEESLELAPGSYLACGQAAECHYWSRTDPRRADSLYRRAIALAESVLAVAPGDLDAASSLIGYHLKSGRPDSARAWLRRVLDRRPLEPEVQFRLAAAYEQLGERDEAMAWLERTLAGGYSLATVERYPGLDRLRAEEPAYRALRARHAREKER